jgi:hypothetical protein
MKQLRGISASVTARRVTRRTLLDWLGTSAVLSLTACQDELLVGGGTAGAGGPSTGGSGSGGATGHAAGGPPTSIGARGGAAGAGRGNASGDGGAGGGAGSERGGVPFAPGPEPTDLGNWRQRTVDPQDLVSILATWQLTIDGMVRAPRVLSFAEVTELPRQDQITDFHCVEGWSVYDVPWNGVHISQLLDLVEPLAGATHLTFDCFGDGYDESLPLGVALEPRTMLAYGVGGNTLPLAHGFPLRTVVPRLFGYKNAKHVQRIVVTDQPVDGYWVRRGYPYAGEVQESRLREGKY